MGGNLPRTVLRPSRVSSCIHAGMPGVRGRTSMTPMMRGSAGAGCRRPRSHAHQPGQDREHGDDAEGPGRPASAPGTPGTGVGARTSSGVRRGRGGLGSRSRKPGERHDCAAAQERLPGVAVEHEREPGGRSPDAGIVPAFDAGGAQRLADGLGVEHATVEAFGEPGRMLVAHVSDGAHHRHRAAEQEGVGDARHRGFPLPDGAGPGSPARWRKRSGTPAADQRRWLR